MAYTDRCQFQIVLKDGEIVEPLETEDDLWNTIQELDKALIETINKRTVVPEDADSRILYKWRPYASD